MKTMGFNLNMTQYNRGDIITGTIVMIGSSEVVVSLGGLKEGVFPKSELGDAFKVGDAILVFVTGKIDDKGCLVLTHAGVNDAVTDKEKLNNLKVGGVFTFVADELNNSGIVGDLAGYRVFLPFSQCSIQEYNNKNNLKGRKIEAVVLEINNLKKSIVCSTKLMLNKKIKPVEVGEVVGGTVVKLEDRYALVMLDNGAKAKLSISDASYQHLNTIREVVELNEHYQFKVLFANVDFSRVEVGLKQLQTSPMDELFKSLKLGDAVEGEVVKILPTGALIKLDNGITAFASIRRSEERRVGKECM